MKGGLKTMTREDAERLVYVYYTRGRLEDEAREYGYKYNVAKAKREKLEQFVIDKLTENK